MEMAVGVCVTLVFHGYGHSRQHIPGSAAEKAIYSFDFPVSVVLL